MAADVTSLVRVLAGGVYKDEKHPTVGNEQNSERSTVLITRDLLGGSSKSVAEFQELDLDLQVPNGWEKRLDLKVLFNSFIVFSQSLLLSIILFI